MRMRFALRLIATVTLLATSGCAFLFLSEPYPSTLTGMWLDSTTAIASDSSFWMLMPNGEERTLRVVAVRAVDGSRRWERNVGPVDQWWHVEGRLSDTTNRRLCITIRPRGGGGCHRFDLDTVKVGDRTQRRLVVYAYPMDRPHHIPMDHLLLEWLAVPR
jgi:hypothetical protein